MQAETAVSTATSRGFAPTADAMIRAHLAKMLSREDLVLVHGYFIRNSNIDPLRAHGIIKALHACGQVDFPSTWSGVKRHVESAEYHYLERELTEALLSDRRRCPFRIGDVAVHVRTQSYALVHSLQLGNIHLRNETLDAQVRKDCWHESLQPVYFPARR